MFYLWQGGKHVLQIPASLWTILIQNKRFEGIRPSPNPRLNPDGSYTVELTTIQWNVFQDNQKKPPVLVPAEPEKSAPGKKPESTSLVEEPEKPGEKPQKKSPPKADKKIHIERDFRML